MPNENSRPKTPVTGFRRYLFIGLGFVFVGLGALGVALPLVPATPFLLLASYFFIRSSPKLNDMLLRSKLFGPILRDWQEKRAVRRHVKFMAISVIPLTIGASIYIAQLSWPLVVIMILLGCIGLIVVIRLPVVEDDIGETEELDPIEDVVKRECEETTVD